MKTTDLAESISTSLVVENAITYEVRANRLMTSWYVDNQLHRENGPAVEYYWGDKFWCFHNKFHRMDGPAVEYINGDKDWYFHGKLVECSSQAEFEKLIKLKAFW